MARVFAYLMNSDVDLADDAIFLDTSNAIEKSIKSSYNKNSAITGIYKNSLELALNQLL